ncbi:ribokinase [Acetobacter sp. AN02]|uniref:ribokinase n=1 Tax=Acetobacter sp. AN02 TaxID=2894186 RepID=UPI0024340D8C|nr:ribokinase [Acetobacter sp. AN02]MDG6095716.1 ribokinase [Acetobacter sp. AN02]
MSCLQKSHRRVAVLGSINIDIIAKSSSLPHPGETIIAENVFFSPGGKGANQAIALRRLEIDVMFSGTTGDDSFGDMARKILIKENISLDHIKTLPSLHTGLALISIDSHGENMITVSSGANSELDEVTAREIIRHLNPGDFLLLQREIPPATNIEAIRLAVEKDIRVILDPAPAPPEGISDDLLRKIFIITPNETETECLTGIRPHTQETALTAARQLRERGVSIAIVKLGAAGVCYAGPDEEGFIPPFRVTSTDSVAAGDCFNAGLASALLRDAPLPEAVRTAAACGALATTKKGGADSAPYAQEVSKLLREQ